MKASKNAVKQLPPPVDAFLLSVAYPPGIAGQVPPADAQHAAASAVHAPLQEWTVVWHPGTQVRRLLVVLLKQYFSQGINFCSRASSQTH